MPKTKAAKKKQTKKRPKRPPASALKSPASPIKSQSKRPKRSKKQPKKSPKRVAVRSPKSFPQSVSESQTISPETVSLVDSSDLNFARNSANNCPLWLRFKPIACDKWHELYAALLARRQLEVVDWDLLALYCDCWQEICDADELLGREGEFQMTEKGYTYAHPAVQKRNTAIERLKKIASDLGIGFRARKGTRGSGGGSESSDLDEF